MALREKCPNTGFFLVRIFLYLDWILEKTDQKKLCIWTLFAQCDCWWKKKQFERNCLTSIQEYSFIAENFCGQKLPPCRDSQLIPQKFRSSKLFRIGHPRKFMSVKFFKLCHWSNFQTTSNFLIFRHMLK